MKSFLFLCILFSTIIVHISSSDGTELDSVRADALYNLERLSRIPFIEIWKVDVLKSILDQAVPVGQDVSSKLKEFYKELDKPDNHVLTPQLKEIKNLIEEKLTYLTSRDMLHKIEETMDTDVSNQLFNQLPKSIQNELISAGKEVNKKLKKILNDYLDANLTKKDGTKA